MASAAPVTCHGSPPSARCNELRPPAVHAQAACSGASGRPDLPRCCAAAAGQQDRRNTFPQGEVSSQVNRIFPALCSKFHDATRIRVQQDGARCHTGEGKNGAERITAALNEAGAKCSPPIEVVTQSAQSPDFNINDLAFFRALSCAVSKVRRGKVNFDKDKLAADVMEAWENYSEEKLARMWEYHRYCLQAALDCNGGNWYAKHRTAEQKAAVAVSDEPPKKRQRGPVPTGVVRRIWYSPGEVFRAAGVL